MNVSIRSRRLGREMHFAFTMQISEYHVSIRSRRLGREMPSLARNGRIYQCFNPLPAVRPGDARKLLRAVSLPECFNPLPAVRPGDA